MTVDIPKPLSGKKARQAFDELQHEINLMLEHAINVANMASTFTDYDIIARPKGRKEGAEKRVA